MRIVYSLVFYLLTPFILLRLVWRGFKAPAYRHRWLERFAIYAQKPEQGVIWFHAVSVGEAESVFPLVRLVQQSHSDTKILITTTTPTGSARVKAVMGNTVEHVYLPYDLPGAVGRFLKFFQPCLAVVMETEIWPNLFFQCGQGSIPLIIINARLSEKSAKGYQKIASLVRPTLSNVKLIATQTQLDAERYISIGADKEKVEAIGNIKFDLEISAQIPELGQLLKKNNFPDRFVWTIASTHKGEEEIFLQLYQQLKPEYPELLLILVPRHPERFAEVRDLCRKTQLNIIRRTEALSCTQDTDVFLVDTMGELKLIYAASDLCFVGGSMVPVGGHNVLEPAVLGVPVLFGPYMSNFNEIAKTVLAAGAAIQCQDPAMIASEFTRLVENIDERKKLADKGRAFIKNNQGTISKIAEIIKRYVGTELDKHTVQ